MNKEQQIEEMAVIGCVRNPQAHTAEECAKCDFKNGQCNSYRHAEALYNAGYRKTFTSDLASDTQKAYKEGYIKGIEEREAENERLTERLKQVLLSVDTVKEMNAMCNIDEQRKQAVKEFAEKLKNVIHERDYLQGYAEIGLIEEIDELLKEYEQ
jgi:hypothetical protein